MTPPFDALQLRDSLSLQADVVFKGHGKYQDAIKRWSSAAEKPAAIVVFPACVSDVKKAVLFAAENKLELAVKGGGHATSGSSSTDGGLCIDLSKMREVTVNVEKKTITAQGGALWSNVYAAGEKYELACVGGAVDHTGVGGLTLGGGYGWLQGEHGLVIDNLLSVDFVLADGTFVTASESENSDLFWAARGAGASFGVATSFTYRAHDQKNPVWSGELVLPVSQLGKVIDAANKIMAIPDEKTMMLVVFAAPPPTHSTIIVLALYHNGPEAVAKKIFAPLFNLEIIVNTTKTMTYPALHTLFNGMAAHGVRRSMKGSAFTLPLSVDFATSILHDFEAFVREVPDAGQSSVMFEYFQYEKMASVPQTATAFANRGNYANILLTMGWTKEENDLRCREWTRDMSAKAREEFERSRQALRHKDENTQIGVGEYFNYDGTGGSGEKVFGVNFPRLVALKKKYDPTNLFSNGPKLLS